MTMAKYGLNEHGFPNYKKQDCKWLEEFYPELYKWLKEMTCLLRIESLADIKNYGEGIRITLYTDLHEFYITANRSTTEGGGYLSLIFSMRGTGAGNDLHNGSYSKATFDRIMLDIVGTVLISLERRNNPNHRD